MRDFIPEGEEPTEAEQKVIARSIPQNLSLIEPDFVPGPDDPTGPGLSREEKMDVAARAASLRQGRSEEREMEAARRKLGILSARSAIEFMQTLSRRQKAIYVRAELEGQARASIISKFKAYLPPTSGPDKAPTSPAQAGEE
jgi:hypothetical protein